HKDYLLKMCFLVDSLNF
ncbi:DNA replication and repair protein RecF, partial [Haemophilus influenzae]